MTDNPRKTELIETMTDLQVRFAHEFLLDVNATRAIERAGSHAKNLTVAGSEFLANPNVAELIAILQAERAKKIDFDADKLLKILVEDIEADASELYDDEGLIKPIHEWPERFRKGLVVGIEHENIVVTDKFSGEKVIRSRISKIRLGDKTPIKNLAGKHVRVQAFRENVALSSPSGGPVEIKSDVTIKLAADEWRKMIEGN